LVTSQPRATDYSTLDEALASRGTKPVAHLDSARLEVLLLDCIEDGKPHLRGQRIGNMPGRMEKAFLVAVALDRFGGHHGGERHSAQGLRAKDQKPHVFELPGIRGGHSYDAIEDIAPSYVGDIMDTLHRGLSCSADFARAG